MFKIFCIFPLFLACGCVSLPRLSPVDLAQPGWQVREGQAVWRTQGGKVELAGEVLLARHSDGRTFVQFTKTPFPIVIAQSTHNRWQIEIPAQNKRYTGPGKAPTRFPWLQLPALLEGAPPPKGWTWTREGDTWSLSNADRSESLEGFFSPAGTHSSATLPLSSGIWHLPSTLIHESAPIRESFVYRKFGVPLRAA